MFIRLFLDPLGIHFCAGVDFFERFERGRGGAAAAAEFLECRTLQRRVFARANQAQQLVEGGGADQRIRPAGFLLFLGAGEARGAGGEEVRRGRGLLDQERFANLLGQPVVFIGQPLGEEFRRGDGEQDAPPLRRIDGIGILEHAFDIGYGRLRFGPQRQQRLDEGRLQRHLLLVQQSHDRPGGLRTGLDQRAQDVRAGIRLDGKQFLVAALERGHEGCGNRLARGKRGEGLGALERKRIQERRRELFGIQRQRPERGPSALRQLRVGEQRPDLGQRHGCVRGADADQFSQREQARLRIAQEFPQERDGRRAPLAQRAQPGRVEALPVQAQRLGQRRQATRVFPAHALERAQCRARIGASIFTQLFQQDGQQARARRAPLLCRFQRAHSGLRISVFQEHLKKLV